MRIMLLIALVALTSSCGKLRFFKKSSQTNNAPLKVSGTLKVSVFYEPGAEPYTTISGSELGLQVNALPVWNVLQDNLKAMFPNKNIIVPKELSAMSQISAQNQVKWTYAEINDLGENLGASSAGDTTVFNIFFVKGNADTGNGVIGVHLSGTRTMAIFKDVVAGSGGSNFVRTYVEQATLVHEMGHAVGLVNNGIPMTSAHEDSAHKAHCSNPDCVMYWQNEGASDLVNFINSRPQSLNLVMLDNACIKDVTSHK